MAFHSQINNSKSEKKTPLSFHFQPENFGTGLNFNIAAKPYYPKILKTEKPKPINALDYYTSDLSLIQPDKYSNQFVSNITSSSSTNIMSSTEAINKIDFSKEMKEAEKNKEKFLELSKKEQITNELRGLLNKLTKNNFDAVKNKIIKLINNNKDNQAKLIEILFPKAINEKRYIELYAKISKDLDNELFPKDKTSKQNSSYFRNLLIEKLKIFFNLIKEENNTEEEIENQLVLG